MVRNGLIVSLGLILSLSAKPALSDSSANALRPTSIIETGSASDGSRAITLAMETPNRQGVSPRPNQPSPSNLSQVKQVWDVGPDGPKDEWGLTDFDWNILNTTMLLWKAGFFENTEKVFDRARQGDVKALVMMYEFAHPHSRALPRTCLSLEGPNLDHFTGKNLRNSSPFYAYRPTTNCDPSIARYEDTLSTAGIDLSRGADLRRFHLLAQSNLPRAWLTASMMFTSGWPQSIAQSDVALRGSLAQSVRGKLTLVSDQNVEQQYNYQCALWLEAIEYGALVAVIEKPQGCDPRKFARLGHPVASQFVNEQSVLLSRAFLAGACDAGILLSRGWPNNGSLKAADAPMVKSVSKAAAKLGCLDTQSLPRGAAEDWDYQIELDHIKYAAFGLNDAEIAERSRKVSPAYWDRMEIVRQNGRFQEDQNVLPNVTTIQGVLLRELKYVNDRNNPYFQLLSALGGREVLGESIDPIMGRYSFSGDWGSYQLSLFVDNLRCTRSAATTDTIDCNYNQSLGVFASTFGQSFGTGMSTSPRSTRFRWENGRWISPQIRQEFIAGLANAPMAGGPARPGSQSGSSLCRSLNAGLVAAGGRSTSQALSPQTWGC